MNSKLLFQSKARIIGAALLTLVTVTATAEVEAKITKSFPVQPGGQLVVAVDRGAIEIKTADRESVDIEVIRKAGGSRAKAEKTLQDHVVTTTQDGHKLEVRAEFKGEKPAGWFGRSPQLQVKFLITLPRQFDVDLKTAGGSVNVAGLTGKVLAASSGGSLNFTKIEGPLSGHTSGGSITVAGCKGRVELSTSGGSLNLGGIEGDLTGKTSGGSIRADKVTGKSVLKTAGGSMDLAGLKGSMEAATSGGSITAEFLEPPTGECSFKSSGGSITVALDEKFAVDVDLRTSGGRVTTDLPIVSVVQGEPQKNELRGKINGGGPLITAHTSGGSVRLHKR
ncbi:MAG: DUF4097 family beta strand repeat-containing protein [Verrucomicrobiota bacterium]|nr:DUF4097 family beta strand repeat protein [Verrucomicrobiota bacterium]MCC6823458.1 DUF4097 family beta strand repeat protein [Limisphaerales bacterium]